MEQKRKIVPPVYLALSLLAMWALDSWLPIMEWSFQGLNIIGWVLIVLGVGITIWSAGLFGKAETPLVPFEKTTAIVTTGPYKFTRNPMYLGMVLLLTGAAFNFASLSSLLPVLVFAAIIHYNFILGEERFLEELFGDEYLAYKKTVRRWV